MSREKQKKGKKQAEKAKLHKRNPHSGKYNLELLCTQIPALRNFITKNFKGEDSINFADAQAVLLLNKALLISQYELDDWFIPEGYLCPPIPGRADYIHHTSDLLGGSNFGQIPKARVLDIGVGANCIYPIIGSKAYDWSFVGSDIDQIALHNAQEIIASNKRLKGKIELRLQSNSSQILNGVIGKNEKFDLVMSNPPFHNSAEEASKSNQLKVSNLTKQQAEEKRLNFGGQSNELWCPGGEKRFISSLVNESKQLANQVFWFTSLVSKSAHLKSLENSLDFHKVEEVRVINMGQGNKSSRILAWTFLDKQAQKAWREELWPKQADKPIS